MWGQERKFSSSELAVCQRMCVKFLESTSGKLTTAYKSNSRRSDNLFWPLQELTCECRSTPTPSTKTPTHWQLPPTQLELPASKMAKAVCYKILLIKSVLSYKSGKAFIWGKFSARWCSLQKSPLTLLQLTEQELYYSLCIRHQQHHQ